MTQIGIQAVLTEIRRRGWDQVEDANHERFLVEDIDANDFDGADGAEYLIDADAVVEMRDGFRRETIWTRADESAASL